MRNRARPSKKMGQKAQSYRLPPQSQKSESEYQKIYSLSVSMAVDSISMAVDSNMDLLNFAHKVENGVYLVNQHIIGCKTTKNEIKQELQIHKAEFIKFQNTRNKLSKKIQQQKQKPEGIENKQMKETRCFDMKSEKQMQVDDQKIGTIEQLKPSANQIQKIEVQESKQSILLPI